MHLLLCLWEMCVQFSFPITQSRDLPLQFLTFLLIILTLYRPKVALHQQAGAGVPTALYPSVLQQRGGDKLLKGLGSWKLASSLGKDRLGLSKHTLHPLLPSSVLPAFSPCGDAMN